MGDGELDDSPFSIIQNGRALFTSLEELEEKSRRLLKTFQIASKIQGLGFFRHNLGLERKLIPNSRLNLAILDLECTPPNIVGLLFHGLIYQVICYEKEKLNSFNVVLSQLIRILGKTLIFTFSERERRFLHNFLPYQVNKIIQDRTFTFLKKTRINNLQKTSSESLMSALISIGEHPEDDPLLRDNKRINEHYAQGHHELLLVHNKSCLLSTLKIVQKRFLLEKLW